MPVADNDEITAIEARLLQLLCQPGLDSGNNLGNNQRAALREKVYNRLRAYSFRCAIHQALFDCLSELPRNNSERIREFLPVKLVQVGFPEVDLTPFYEPHNLTTSEVERLLESLLEKA